MQPERAAVICLKGRALPLYSSLWYWVNRNGRSEELSRAGRSVLFLWKSVHSGVCQITETRPDIKAPGADFCPGEIPVTIWQKHFSLRFPLNTGMARQRWAPLLWKAGWWRAWLSHAPCPTWSLPERMGSTLLHCPPAAAANRKQTISAGQ